MNDRTKQLALIVLIVVLVAIMAYRLLAKPKPKPKASRRPAEETQVEAAVAKADLPSGEQLSELARWTATEAMGIARVEPEGRFGLPVEKQLAIVPPKPSPKPAARRTRRKAVAAQPPRLDGIIMIGGRRAAVIDGQAYRAGQEVGETGYRIGKIGAGSVQFIDVQGKTFTLNLLQ